MAKEPESDSLEDRWGHRFGQVGRGIQIVSVLVLAVILYMGVDMLIGFYTDNTVNTPEKTVDLYLDALSRNSFAEVYTLTAQSQLVDIYGREVTQSELRDHFELTTNEHTLNLGDYEIVTLEKDQDLRYFSVLISSSSSSTTQGELLLKLIKEDGTWKVVYPFPIIR